jgi:CHAD domain-containing protein
MDHIGAIYSVTGSWDELPDALRALCSCEIQEFHGRRVRFLDTFDWRLFGRGHTLAFERRSDESSLTLSALRGEARWRLAIPSAPAFPSDLPVCPLRRRLEKFCEVRRLLPIVELESKGIEISLLDEERKTVGRVILQESKASDPRGGDRTFEVPGRVRVDPLRGYPEMARRVHALLDTLPGIEPVDRTELELALASVGRFPGDYSSRLEVALYPEMPASEALRTVLRTLLGVLRANQDGIVENLDPEFLHDFRVAIRRSRSLLSQMRRELPAGSTERLREDLNWLGRETGPLRDLDVYSHRLREGKLDLPTEVSRNLVPLIEYIGLRQSEEHERLLGVLDSERYRRLLADWDAFVDGPKGDAPTSTRPVVEPAFERILSVFRRVARLRKRVDDDSSPATLHRTRIECKKLRYLLECFRTLFDPEFIMRQVSLLKSLQDALGEYNDLQTQRNRLHEFAREMASRDKVAPSTLLAMGRLAERMSAAQDREKKRFLRRFGTFAGRSNRKGVRLRMKPRPGGNPI